MGLRASDWCDLLHGMVPGPRLLDAFRRASLDHKSDFPVNAYEVKNAWQKIELEEQKRAEKEARDRASASAIDACEFRDKHWIDPETQADDGLVEFQEGFEADAVHLWPCPYCRRKAFDQRQADFIESKAGSGVPRAVTKAVEQVVKSQKAAKVIHDDGRETLSWAYETLKRQVLEYDRFARTPLSPEEKRIGRHWTREELYAAALSLHEAIECIRLGHEAYAEMKAKEEIA